jgi:DNA-binding transcriptional ArsR family regulator
MIGLQSTTRLLKALADDSRMRILHLLAQEELTGSDLMEILNLGQSRVSTHLTLLREVGLVNDRRAGRRAFYSVAPVLRGLDAHVEEATALPPGFDGVGTDFILPVGCSTKVRSQRSKNVRKGFLSESICQSFIWSMRCLGPRPALRANRSRWCPDDPQRQTSRPSQSPA